MLTGWHVVDLTDHRGDVGPYLLADLGAEVVKVEPPGGCPTRWGPDPGHFAAYNANKRRLELTGDPAADRATVLGLVAEADLVFDSGPPGRLAGLGLGDAELAAANPRVVRVLVTPFGADGPRADQPATELTVAALGGQVRLQGTPDRPPVQFSIPQIWRHAGAEAAVAALVAHRRMRTTGQAQFVDVSAQAAATWTMLNAMEAHAVQGRDFERTGSELHLNIVVQLRLEAADGYVVGVPTARLAGPLHPWLIEEGIVGPEWATIEWATFDQRVIAGDVTEVTMAEVNAAVMELCRRHTRRTLFERGLTFGATLAPLNGVDDLLAFGHLEARGFWATASGPPPARFPGAFLRIDGQRPAATRSWPARPPDGTGGADSAGVAEPADPGGGGGAADPAGGPPAAPRWHSARSAPGPTSPPARGHDRTPEPVAALSVGSAGLPLAGLRVVDFSWIGVGPITAKALADHGATVVRVESERRMDGLRVQPPFAQGRAGINRSQFFGAFNTSKLGLALDLKNPDGADTARRLAGWADVVIESFTPGTIDGLGLGYGELSARNPSLVMVSTSLLGPGSEVSSMAGYGYHAAAIAGFQGLVGWPDLPPDGPWLAYTDTICPRFIVPAILAALDRRQATGQGCYLEVAQLEVALQLLAPELLDHQLTGRLPGRRGNRAPDLAPQGVYPCLGHEQWLALSVVDDGAWSRLVDFLGRPDWATAAGLATVAGRQAAHDTIDAELAAWTAGWDAAELERCLAGAGIAAGVVQASSQLATDPQYAHRRFFRPLEHPEMGVVPYAGHQYRIAGYDHGPRSPAPCLGEHTYEVLTGILGLTPDEVADLAAADALS